MEKVSRRQEKHEKFQSGNKLVILFTIERAHIILVLNVLSSYVCTQSMEVDKASDLSFDL